MPNFGVTYNVCNLNYAALVKLIVYSLSISPGKTYTMIGVDDSPQNLGILPCSIAWLFKLINDQKDQTGARFSVRVSAVEVTGKQEQLKDLLAGVASGKFPEQLSIRG